MSRSHYIATITVVSVLAFPLSGCNAVKEVTGQSKKLKLQISQNKELGAVVTTQDGRTLYRYAKDSANPPVSKCVGECSGNWLPVISPKRPELRGIDPTLVGLFRRSEGGTQVTIGGYPVYTFIKDQRAGDIKGQAIAGTWYAVSPTGTEITTQPSREARRQR